MVDFYNVCNGSWDLVSPEQKDIAIEATKTIIADCKKRNIDYLMKKI